jgi:hypothetical protein
VLEMSTVPVDIHMLENSVSPVVWSCDIHYICRKFESVLVTVHTIYSIAEVQYSTAYGNVAVHIGNVPTNTWQI